MFRIIHKVDSESLNKDKKRLEEWLENKSYYDAISEDNQSLIDNFGNKIRKGCPEALDKSLFYINGKTNSYPLNNHLSKSSVMYTWPLFFEKFPDGQIWILEISEAWWHEIWNGQISLAKKTGYSDKYPDGFLPHESSGLQTDYFPINALSILSYGIYPLISCIHCTISPFNLVIMYIPDQAFEYSQMMDGRTNYQEILWDIHHIFDDQWTFDSSRGPKIRADKASLNPVKQQLNYFEWFIEKINEKMQDIIEISDPFLREQLGMTINRAIFDAQLCVSSELPYMSKIFFFNCLDKLRNIMWLINMEKSENDAWDKLLDEDFLCEEVLEILNDIKGNAGTYLQENVKLAVKEMKLDDISPQDLRDLRNTHHGYKLNNGTINRLMKKTGEFNNDITLIIVPLILFLMSKKWKI